MSFWSDISRFAGNMTGGFIGESDEEKRRKQQQQFRAKNPYIAKPVANSRPATAPRQTYGQAQTPTQQRARQVFSGINSQAGMSMGQRQAQTVARNKVKRGLSVEADPIEQEIDEDRKLVIEQAFNEGKSFEDISDRTGLGVEEVRRYADKKRPDYGKKPMTIPNVLGEVGKQIVDGTLLAPRMVDATLRQGNKDSQNAYEAAKGAFERGEITNQKFFEMTGELAKNVIGKKTIRDKDGTVKVVNQNPLEFAQDFTEAGYGAASVLPIASGAKLAGLGGKQLLKEIAKEGATWGTIDTANDTVQGRLSPEQIAANYALNIGMVGGGAALGKGGKVLKGAQMGPNAERGALGPMIDPSQDARDRFAKGKDLGDKDVPQIDTSPETLMARAVDAGMTPQGAAGLMNKIGRNKFRVMLDESGNLNGAKNPEALANYVAKNIPDGSKQIGGVATKNDLMPEEAGIPKTQEALDPLRDAEVPTESSKQTKLEVAYGDLERVTDDKAWAQDSKYIAFGKDNDARRMAQVLDRRMNVLAVIQKGDVKVTESPDGMVQYWDAKEGHLIAEHHVDSLTDKIQAYAKMKKLSDTQLNTPIEAKDYNPTGQEPLPSEPLMNKPGQTAPVDAPEPASAPIVDKTVKAKASPWTAPQKPKDAPKTLEKALPKKDASIDDVTKAFPEFQAFIGNLLNTLRADLKARGIDERDFVRAMITERHTDTKMPKDLKKLYKEELAPLLEYMRNHSRTKVNDGRKSGEVYFHERGNNTPDDTVEIYGSVVETVDTSFGASKANKGKLVSDEDGNLTFDKVDDNLGAYQNYADQWFIDKYKPQMLAKKSGKSVEYHEAQKDLGDRIVQKVNKSDPADDSINAEKIDYVAEHENIGKLSGDDMIPVDHKLGSLRSGLTDDASKLKAVELDDVKNPKQKTNAYKQSGIERYDYAQNRSHQQVAELFPDGEPAFSKEEMHQRLLVDLADANISEDALNQAIRGTMSHIDRILIARDKAITADDFAEVKFQDSRVEHALRSLNKRVGREELSQFLSTHEIKDNNLRGVFNYQAERMLAEDRIGQSMANKIVDKINRQVTWGALGLNINSIMLNFTEIKRVYANFGVIATGKAIYRGFKDGKTLLEHYGVEPTHFENTGEYALHLADGDEAVRDSLMKAFDKNYENVMNVSMIGFKASEEFKDKVFLAAYKAKAEEMTPEQRGGKSVDDWVMDRFQKEAIKYGKSGTIGLNKNPAFRALFQFSQYWIKDATITARKTKGALGGDKQDALYLARLGVANAALYSVLAPIMGSSMAMIFNSQPPTGGPAMDFIFDLYNAYEEQEQNKQKAIEADEKAEEPDIRKAAERALKKDTALAIPGGNQMLNKTGVQAFLPDSEDKGWGQLNPKNFYKDGYWQDRKRGFNLNQKGKERFAIDQNSSYELAKGMVNGSYNQKNAREYFGKSDIRSDIPVIGKNWKNTPGMPVWDDTQKEIAAAKTIKDKQAIFNKFKDDRIADAKVEKDFLASASKADIAEYYRLNGKVRVEGQSKIEKLAEKIGLGKEAKLLDEFWSGPQRAYYKTEYGSDGRKASDLISPEKWKIQWDNPGVFKKEKEDALAKNKRDGAPVDPIYLEKDSKMIKELLQLRSAVTGDMTEREEILKATSPDYVAFKEKEKKYYDESKAFFDKLGLGDDKENLRALEYRKLGTLVPQPALVAEYFKVMDASGKAEANKLFKIHGDALSAEFDAYSKARLDQINAKRKIELGDAYVPISIEVFQNKTFGFTGNADGTDVEGSGYGSGWNNYAKGSGSRGGRSGGGGSDNPPNTGIADTISNFGNSASGIAEPKMSKGKLVDSRKVVKKMKRASGMSSIRIRI